MDLSKGFDSLTQEVGAVLDRITVLQDIHDSSTKTMSENLEKVISSRRALAEATMKMEETKLSKETETKAGTFNHIIASLVKKWTAA